MEPPAGGCAPRTGADEPRTRSAQIVYEVMHELEQRGADLNEALALVEVGGWSPAMVILDAMEKTAGDPQSIQAELNDQPGVCLKLTGPLATCDAAVDAAERIADQMQVDHGGGRHCGARRRGFAVAYEAQARLQPVDRAGHRDHPGYSPEKKERTHV